MKTLARLAGEGGERSEPGEGERSGGAEPFCTLGAPTLTLIGAHLRNFLLRPSP